ncbi:hypothetical protein FWK35_00023805 [Aphis craccivora]|uniref:Uncharacterized protein n=1 Tax=Aphis craccivora TaxID=307492 RepID=A0A6G0YDD8_APHCR|nr:hypothetical protein FWK35_00023805 [Aphis craccivora]
MYRYTQLVVFVFLFTLSVSLSKSISVTTEGYKCQRGQCWTEVEPRDDFCSEMFRYEFITLPPANVLCYCCRRI